MSLRPPRTTRTCTLVPDPTLFRSGILVNIGISRTDSFNIYVNIVCSHRASAVKWRVSDDEISFCPFRGLWIPKAINLHLCILIGNLSPRYGMDLPGLPIPAGARLSILIPTPHLLAPAYTSITITNALHYPQHPPRRPLSLTLTPQMPFNK